MVSDILQKLPVVLFSRYNLQFYIESRVINNYREIHLTPESSDVTESFKLIIKIGWKKLFFNFIPGGKAGLLLIAMSNSSIENKNLFVSVSKNIISRRGTIDFYVNDSRQNHLSYQEWPANWYSFSLSMSSPFIETDSDLSEENQLEDLIITWTSLFFSMIFPLLPIVSDEDFEIFNQIGDVEGAKFNYASNRYERSRKNRAVCLATNGYKCKICNFDFEDTYGQIGAGYIEVHHIIPVSSLGENYLINPVTDLVPLCANCHSMIHRKDPPYTIDELHSLYKSASKIC